MQRLFLTLLLSTFLFGIARANNLSSPILISLRKLNADNEKNELIKGHRTPPMPLVYIIQDNDSNEEVLPNGEPIINVEIVDERGNLIINTCSVSIFKSVLFSLLGTYQIIITTDISHYSGEVNIN